MEGLVEAGWANLYWVPLYRFMSTDRGLRVGYSYLIGAWPEAGVVGRGEVVSWVICMHCLGFVSVRMLLGGAVPDNASDMVCRNRMDVETTKPKHAGSACFSASVNAYCLNGEVKRKSDRRKTGVKASGMLLSDMPPHLLLKTTGT